MSLMFNVLGNIGTLCFLYAFFMLQKGKFAPDSYSYLGLNLAGSILLLASLSWDWNMPAFLLESAWGIISAWGLLRRWRKVAA